MVEKVKEPFKNESVSYDQEWIELIKYARQSGFTSTEIRNFLQKGETYTSMKSSPLKSDLQHT